MAGLTIFRETAFLLYMGNRARPIRLLGDQDHGVENVADMFAVAIHALNISAAQKALFSLGKLAPTLAAVGSASVLCTIPFAIFILLNMKFFGSISGAFVEVMISQRAGSFVSQTASVISDASRSVGIESLLKGAAKSITPLCRLALLVAAVSAIYFGGAYVLGGLSLGYQLFDAAQKVPKMQVIAPKDYSRIQNFLLGFGFLICRNMSGMIFGAYFIKQALPKPSVLPTIPDLETRELPDILSDSDIGSLQTDKKHMRPANALKDLPVGFDYAKELLKLREEVKLDEKFVLAQEFIVGGTERRFTDFDAAKAHIKNGIENFIRRIQSGNKRQEDLVARAVYIAKTGSVIDQQDLIINFAKVGFLCSSGKAGAIDGLNAGFGGTGLVAQIEHVLRLKRDELYNQLFLGPLKEKFPREFGPGQRADINNVHSSSAWLFVSGATKYALTTYGRAVEEAEGAWGVATLRLARHVFEQEAVKEQVRASEKAFDEIYNADYILRAISEALKPQEKVVLDETDKAFIQNLTKSQLFQDSAERFAQLPVGSDFKEELEIAETQIFGEFQDITPWQKSITEVLLNLYIEERRKEEPRSESDLFTQVNKVIRDLKQARQKESSLNISLFIREWFIDWAIQNKKAEFTAGDRELFSQIVASFPFQSSVDRYVIGNQKDLQADALDNAIEESAGFICTDLSIHREDFGRLFTKQLLSIVVEKRRLNQDLSTDNVLKNKEDIEGILLQAKAIDLANQLCYDEETFELKPEVIATMLVEKGFLKFQ